MAENEMQSKVLKSLATITRRGYGDKLDEQMRIEVCEFSGKPYISMRLWWQPTLGEWAPSKKGISVRISELDQVLKALHDAETETFRLEQGKPVSASKPIAKPRTKSDPIKSDGTIDDENVF